MDAYDKEILYQCQMADLGAEGVTFFKQSENQAENDIPLKKFFEVHCNTLPLIIIPRSVPRIHR